MSQLRTCREVFGPGLPFFRCNTAPRCNTLFLLRNSVAPENRPHATGATSYCQTRVLTVERPRLFCRQQTSKSAADLPKLCAPSPPAERCFAIPVAASFPLPRRERGERVNVTLPDASLAYSSGKPVVAPVAPVAPAASTEIFAVAPVAPRGIPVQQDSPLISICCTVAPSCTGKKACRGEAAPKFAAQSNFPANIKRKS
jgi:hypothetical protein